MLTVYRRLYISALGVAKRKSYTVPSNGGPWHRNFENAKFSKMLTNLSRLVLQFDEFRSLARISMPCGGALSIHMTRRVVTPKSGAKHSLLMNIFGWPKAGSGGSAIRGWILDTFCNFWIMKSLPGETGRRLSFWIVSSFILVHQLSHLVHGSYCHRGLARIGRIAKCEISKKLWISI